MEGRKFAVLLCAEDSDYVMNNYGGYYGVYARMLKEEGETWDEFKVARGEFPADDEVAEYDGFVITGSCSDADSNEIWICKLVVLLRRLDAMKKKILGICFGHQAWGKEFSHITFLGGTKWTTKAIGIINILLFTYFFGE